MLSRNSIGNISEIPENLFYRKVADPQDMLLLPKVQNHLTTRAHSLQLTW